jgi:hypothetical protein
MVAVGVAFVAARPAAAQVSFYNVCSPGSFHVCASAEVSLVGGNMVMKVWNMNQYGLTGAVPDMSAYGSEFGGWGTITAVGLNGVGYTLPDNSKPTVSAAYWNGTSTTALSLWGTDAVANSIQIYNTGADADKGHKEGIVGCSDPGPLKAGHVATCGSYPTNPYVEFTFTGLQNINLDNATFAFHAQQVANENCTPTSYESSCLFANSLKADGSGGGNMVTPEPVSTMLVGTGLLGLAAARRRKKAQAAESA